MVLSARGARCACLKRTMATAVSRHQNNRRFDGLFFSSITAVILASVFGGRTQLLSGRGFQCSAAQPARSHHGAVLSCWIVLLIVQTSLVAAGRVDVHLSLGLGGFGLACLVLVLGVNRATDWCDVNSRRRLLSWTKPNT